MIRASFSAAICVALCGCTTVPKTVQPTEQEPSSGLVRDAEILRAGLEQIYPSLNRYGQEDEVRQALAKLEYMAFSDSDEQAFYQAVASVAAATRDEHVIPYPSEQYRQSRRSGQMMLPHAVQWIGSVPYVAAVADPEYSHLVGRQIASMDGLTAFEVAKTLFETIPSDGNSATFAKRRLQDFTPTQNENYFDLNYPIWFGERDAYRLTTIDEQGERETSVLEALDWPGFSSFYRSRLPREEPITFRWVAPDVGYLLILSFHDWYYEEHGIDAETRLESIFAELASRPQVRLVLDLRRNEGGGDISSLLLDWLLQKPFREYDRVLTRFVGTPQAAQYCQNEADVSFNPEWAYPVEGGLYALKQEFEGLITGASERAPRENAFSGSLVVLISGVTGSAAAKVAAVLEREDRAFFIGEETGGAAAGATAYGYCSLWLPHSDIKVDIPLIRFERNVDVEYGRGVLPDLKIDAGRIPPITKDDQVVSAALDYIAGRTAE